MPIVNNASLGHPKWILVAFAALYLLVRLPVLGAHGLWVDEAFSLAMATGHSLEHPPDVADAQSGDYIEVREAKPAAHYARYLEHEDEPAGFARVLRAVALSDTSPPLYYLGLDAWTRVFGSSDEALRAFSAWWGLLCLPLLMALARDFGGRYAVVPTLLMFAVAPLSVYYTTEGRMYSLLLLLTIALVYLTRLVQRSSGTGVLLGWTVVAIAGLWTHYFFGFALSAAGLWLLVDPGPRTRRSILMAACTVLVLVAPWYVQIPTLEKQWRVTSGWMELEPGGGTFAGAALYLLVGQLSIAGIWGVPGRLFALDGTIYLALAVLVLVMYRGWIFNQQRILLWLWLAAPLLGVIGLGLLLGNYLPWNIRYALAAMPAAHLLVGVSVARLPRPLRYAFITLLTLTSAVGCYYAFSPARLVQPWAATARALSAVSEPGDVVIVQSIPSGVTLLARYLVAENSPLEVVSWVDRLDGHQPDSDLMMIAEGRRNIYFVRGHAIFGSDALERALADRWELHPVAYLGQIEVYRAVIEEQVPPPH